MGDEHEAEEHNNGDDTTNGLGETATSLVDGLNTLNDKVTAMRTARIQDPDSMGDKLIKLAVPAITGLVAGKVFEALWKAGTTRRTSPPKAGDDDTQQGLAISLLFAGLSAAFGAVISQLSQRGSQSFVSRRQRRRDAK